MSHTINENEYPSFYYCRHLKDGLVAYGDDNDQGFLLVNENVLKEMAPSLVGKPIYSDHMKHFADGNIGDGGPAGLPIGVGAAGESPESATVRDCSG